MGSSPAPFSDIGKKAKVGIPTYERLLNNNYMFKLRWLMELSLSETMMGFSLTAVLKIGYIALRFGLEWLSFKCIMFALSQCFCIVY